MKKIIILTRMEDCETTEIIRAFSNKRNLNRYLKENSIFLDTKEFPLFTTEECYL
ncbi:MAG: hypothetical protein M0R17_05595 [Candidatus Omnitrophica bacterium]|jgi:hypothetical protein|nr:hypothetical protein [Candidatus Omnitrophota bacterium]